MTEEVQRVASGMGWAGVGKRRLRARQTQDGRLPRKSHWSQVIPVDSGSSRLIVDRKR